MKTESDRRVDVSIVVPVHNCRPYLDRCLTSLLAQSVSKEIVVVDDGSTDGSRDLLADYALRHPEIRVFHQPASGGAARPRNRAIAHAGGRYVFFCDADDHLGPEALLRMLAMADRNGSDIVLGKIIGHGRKVPSSMFRENRDRAPLGETTVYNSLACFKLFRRELLTRHRIRFDESLRVGEDMVFSVHAYCHAQTISVVADHDCYNLVARPDGGSIMQEPGSRDPLAWLRMVRVPVELMLRHVHEGPLRDHLLRRHFRFDILAQLGEPFLAAGPATRLAIAGEVAELCALWMTDGAFERLRPIDRLRATSLGDVDRLARLARVEAAGVRCRLTGLAWAGDRLEVAGTASLTDSWNGVTVGLLLRERSTTAERRVPVTSVADVFAGGVEVSRLPPGVWDVYVVLACEGVRRTARFGTDRAPSVQAPGPRLAAAVAVPYFTRPYGNLSIDVGGHVVAVPGSVRLARASWAPKGVLTIEGTVTVGDGRAAARTVRDVVWRERASGAERRAPASPLGAARFTATVTLDGPGVWEAGLELDLGGPPVRYPVQVGDAELGPGVAWWRGRRRWTALARASKVRRKLVVSVLARGPRAVVRRSMRIGR
ncbi:glycosyltransferase family 2 protein [Sphaerisporangium sp. TRM90804]|uniref:glycosyltransferase family 2 protein n=1 Tax=Sphaerisporangium sp. TRM90804 TaxID=3031113 RepID=UPI00244C1D12|nr:glycosyltransferase family 2 protein [Sphaerisporangium sp. TRM90804]MDH2427041.1 glycosyltransferase family 2 protein [Sphaerisporangium sp. TRM90804]